VVAAALLAEHLAGAGVPVAAGMLVVGSLVTLAFGGRATTPEGRHDPGWVVSDEWAGQGLAWLIAAPGLEPLLAGATFVLFRLFDIAKPPPIGRLQRVPGGAGVLLDDLAAGLLAGLLVAAPRWFG
jgi:phosphatidylglycerophosphatase A